MTIAKIATWNVNGIRARHAEVVDFAARVEPDVLCLQELKAAPADIPDPLLTLEAYHSYWHGQKGYSGVSLHVKRALCPARPEFAHPPFDHESRIVTVRVGDLTVASVYVPNGGKDYPAKIRFLEAMASWAGAFRATGAPLIICGDLNVARTDQDVHPRERKPGVIGQRPEERALIEALLAQQLTDVGRALDPTNEDLFTWWAPWRNLRQRNIGWRLDYVLASPTWAARAVSCPALREVGTSDHGPVVATFTDATGGREARPAG